MPDPDAALTIWAYIAGPMILGLGGLAAAAAVLLWRGKRYRPQTQITEETCLATAAPTVNAAISPLHGSDKDASGLRRMTETPEIFLDNCVIEYCHSYNNHGDGLYIHGPNGGFVWLDKDGTSFRMLLRGPDPSPEGDL